MTEKKANHQANIVSVQNILPHNNADTLEIITVGEYQVVSKKGQFKVGDLAIYIQPDSVVPQTEPFKFIWEPYMCVPCVEDPAPEGFVVPERRRRITVRKFRGEWSEGLLLPIADFHLVFSGIAFRFGDPYIVGARGDLNYFEGEDVSDLLGITHYDPDAGTEKGQTTFAPKLRKKYPRSLTGWLKFIKRKVYGIFRSGPLDGKTENISLGIPTYDVDAYKNYPHTFKDGELVIVTEKIHGSNARYIFLDGIMYAGSRNLWKSPNSDCIFRKVLKAQPWIEQWCRAHPGYVLWGEVTPTQGGFNYGSKEPQFFVFDIRTPEGEWADINHPVYSEVTPFGFTCVPFIYKGPFDIETIKQFVDGESYVKGAKHLREGIVIRTRTERIERGLGRAQLKIVSNAFLAKDSK